MIIYIGPAQAMPVSSLLGTLFGLLLLFWNKLMLLLSRILGRPFAKREAKEASSFAKPIRETQEAQDR